MFNLFWGDLQCCGAKTVFNSNTFIHSLHMSMKIMTQFHGWTSIRVIEVCNVLHLVLYTQKNVLKSREKKTFDEPSRENQVKMNNACLFSRRNIKKKWNAF